jgi:hypothetical protein
MVLSDWTSCPDCKFPALYSVLSTQLAVMPTCPMCEHELKPETLVKISEAEAKTIIMTKPTKETDTEMKDVKESEKEAGDAKQGTGSRRGSTATSAAPVASAAAAQHAKPPFFAPFKGKNYESDPPAF